MCFYKSKSTRQIGSAMGNLNAPYLAHDHSAFVIVRQCVAPCALKLVISPLPGARSPFMFRLATPNPTQAGVAKTANQPRCTAL